MTIARRTLPDRFEKNRSPLKKSDAIAWADEELVGIFNNPWYQDVRSRMTQGAVLKIYRENHGISQAEPGRR